MAASALICLGVIAGAHGLAGAVRVHSFTAEPEAIAAYGPLSDEAGERTFRLAIVGRIKNALICCIDGISDRTAAEGLRGMGLYVPRAALPALAEEEYYHADLIGLRADVCGAAAEDSGWLGRVVAVHDFGAGPVLEIAEGPGGSVLIPFTRAAVPEVDLAAGRIGVAPLPGLLAPAESDDARNGGSGPAEDDESRRSHR